MRRILVVLLAALGLALLAWFALRTPPSPAAAVQPARQPSLTDSEAPRAAQMDAVEARVAADSPPQKAESQAATSAPSPSAPADPTEEALAAFAREVPPGTIEGIVLRGSTPVEGGFAWLGSVSTGGLPWGSAAAWDAAPNVSRAPIGPDGIFRFVGLETDQYGVGVQAPDGATRHVYCDLNADEPSQRIRIVLGAGGVRGHVYDEDGRPCAGWSIGVYNYGNVLAGVQVIDGRETDSAGAFEFGGLVGGNYMLSAGPVVDRRDPRTRTLDFQLLAGEWKTVDVGSPGQGVRWTGRVLLPRGAPLQIAGLTELRIQANDARETAALTPQSSFDVLLAEGTYQVSLFAYSRVGGELVELGEVVVPAKGLERDIVLPRALLRVRATYQGTQQEPRAALFALTTWLQGRDFQRRGLRGEDGNEYFFALAPGEYELSASPTILGAPGEKLPVRILESDDEVEVDLVVGDP